MAKAKSKVTGRCRIFVGSITIHGRTTTIDYQRTEYSDGRVVERGRPKGTKPDASIGDIFRAAIEQQDRA